MKSQEISAAILDPETKEPVRQVTVTVPEWPEDLKEAGQVWGKDIAFQKAEDAVTVALQGFMRGKMRPGKNGEETTDAEIQTAVDSWKPSQRKPGKTKEEKLQDLLGQMSEEEKRAALENLGLA